MRWLLGGFVAVCAGLFALGGYLAWRTGGEPAPPRVAPGRGPQGVGDRPIAPAPVDGRAPEADSVPSTTPTEPEALAAPEPVRAPVHWAEASPEREEAQRRLAAAREALSRDADSVAALRDAAAAASQLEEWSATTQYLDALARLTPDDPRAHFDAGVAWLKLGRTTRAADAFGEAARLRPDDGRAWHNLAVAHQELGHLDDAERAWTRAIELAPRSLAHAGRGEVRMRRNDYAGAAEDFAAVLSFEPDALDAALNLALAEEQGGNLDAARRTLADYVGRNPLSVPVLNRLAELELRACALAGGALDAPCPNAADYCARSLAIDADQPEVTALAVEARGTQELPRGSRGSRGGGR